MRICLFILHPVSVLIIVSFYYFKHCKFFLNECGGKLHLRAWARTRRWVVGKQCIIGELTEAFGCVIFQWRVGSKKTLLAIGNFLFFAEDWNPQRSQHLICWDILCCCVRWKSRLHADDLNHRLKTLVITCCKSCANAHSHWSRKSILF